MHKSGVIFFVLFLGPEIQGGVKNGQKIRSSVALYGNMDQKSLQIMSLKYNISLPLYPDSLQV